MSELAQLMENFQLNPFSRYDHDQEISDSFIIEQFTLNPFHEMYDPYEYFKEDCEFNAWEYIKEESSEGIPKERLITKIGNLLFRIFERIVKLFNKIVVWIKDLIHGGKKTRTVDDVLEELGLKRSEKAMKKWNNSDDPRSTMSGIKASIKPVIIKMEEDGEITISAKKYWFNKVFSGRQDPATNNHVQGYDPRAYNITMRAISHIGKENDYVAELAYISEDIAKGKLTIATSRLITHLYNKFITNTNLLPKYKITVDKFQQFNKQLLRIHDNLKRMDDTRMSIEIDGRDQNIVKALNQLLDLVANLQIGGTVLAHAIKNVYVIDPEFCESIGNPKVLGEFVNQMLQNGVPDKYIAFNIWMASKQEIKGKARVEDPQWGMTRLTFIPEKPDNVVYKMAINGLGVRANISEKLISDAVYRAGVGEHFAKVIDIHKSNSMITMERAVIDEPRARKVDTEAMQRTLTAAINKANIPGYIGDIRADNIGFRGNTVISFDYGNVKRSVSQPGNIVVAK